MKQILLFCALSLISAFTHAQEKFTINGYVKDSRNGEELIGVSVFVQELKTGTTTNAYGFYSITLPKGTYHLQFSYIGYKTRIEEIQLDQQIERNIDLQDETMEMQEVVVKGERVDANVSNIQMGHTQLNMDQVRKLPMVFGESDLIKTIQMQPGVITAGEGTSSFFVRGGSADQNLILIDEAPVYDPSHLFGLFSVFNSDVVKESELYRGGIPARFGGRLSSILEVRTKDGNNKNLAGSGGIGTMASRFMIEGPMKKEKSSFIVSARRSYVDAFLKLAGETNLVYFYDMNAKLSWKHNNNNRFFVAFYNGRDDFDFDGVFGFGWGNATGTFRWNHLFNDRLFSNTTLIASNFDYKLGFDDPVQGFEWKSRLQQFSLNNDLNYFISPSSEVSFGYHLTFRRFAPATITPTTEGSIFQTVTLEKQFALDHAPYIDFKQKFGDKVETTLGVRLSIFQNVGPYDLPLYADPTDNVNIIRTGERSYERLETVKAYVNAEPRFSFLYILSPYNSIKASYSRMVQNTHLISSGTVPLPFNTWNPSGYYLKPQTSDQYSIGFFQNTHKHDYEFSVETFYKDMNNITDFADNASIFFNQDLSTEFRQGKSWAYGVELSAQKKEGRVTGFLSYTYSKVTRKVPGVNSGIAFPANYDRRNALNVAAVYDLNKKWSFGADFVYGTGRPITVPSGRYEFGDLYQPDQITERNGYRLPSYHRADVSATLTPQNRKQRKWQGQWVFSLYNMYSRKNPFSMYTRLRQDEEGNIIGNGTEKEARMIYLFPILPSVTYNFKF
ncbi:MAG: carboxypeptidase-like regulatory domain-containing protein [Cyclobacteriaceae bacterium]